MKRFNVKDLGRTTENIKAEVAGFAPGAPPSH
jgi:hypothetical protein